ncbi:MAG: GntR family transcriptional regulator [Planctomycetia bacterium]|nr:GntR family transcriptional regulator [Planctomycetia bacterium]
MSITHYIQEDLRARIRAGAELPGKLTLAGLSEFYKVSMMPVRLAVAELVREHLLLREDNGRLTVNPQQVGEQTAKSFAGPPPPPDWYEVIADEVVRRSLRGQASHLKIADVAEQHGIGRSSVHTIFHRLAGLGMLEHVPRCGWQVRPFREEDLDAYLEVRELLELRALELAAPRLVMADLEELLERNRPGDAGSPTQLDNSLHSYWIERSRNRYIQDFFERQGAYYTALYAHAAVGADLVATLAEQHRAILQPLLKKKLRQAQTALAADIRSLRSILKDAIRRLEEGSTAR